MVADGGSRDRTVAVARDAGARVVRVAARPRPPAQRRSARRARRRRRGPALRARRHRCCPRARERRSRRGRRRRFGGGFEVRFDDPRPHLRARLAHREPAHAAAARAARRSGAVRHPRGVPRSRAASASGRSSRTSTSMRRLRRRGAIAVLRPPVDHRGAPLRRARHRAHDRDQLVDLGALPARRRSGPPGPPLSASGVTHLKSRRPESTKPCNSP